MPQSTQENSQENTPKKTALITGAARGIGFATTKRFLKEGWNVVMVDIDGEMLNTSSAQLKKTNSINADCVLPITADVSNQDDIERFISETEKTYGRLDALVNNAGVADFGPIRETTFERWRTVMNTNLDGVFLTSQRAIQLMEKTSPKDGGSIVNIASISGLRASTLRSAYGTSKAAVIQLTLQQAAELGEVGIRANVIAPGPVRTKLSIAVHSQEIIDAYHDAIPLNRYGSEDELANVIWFLSSPDASYVNGQILAVDGGFECTGVGLPALRK